MIGGAVRAWSVLHELTGVIARHNGDIASVEIIEEQPPESRIYFEIELPERPRSCRPIWQSSPIVRASRRGQDAPEDLRQADHHHGRRRAGGAGGIGAISEADRHNIRGEHISVDTIPLVGEQALADAVRAVARLPRARALVLAGALMGGEIEKAVREVRAQGLLVISLNMAGSVPDAADLVVTDPVQAGVMAVMAVADTAKFTVGAAEPAGVLKYIPGVARGQVLSRTPAIRINRPLPPAGPGTRGK